MNAYEIDLTNNNWCVKEIIRNTVIVSVGDKILKIVGALRITGLALIMWDYDGINYTLSIGKVRSFADCIALENGLGKRIFD